MEKLWRVGRRKDELIVSVALLDKAVAAFRWSKQRGRGA